MGCDIHTYVEYADWENEDGPYWKNFTSNGGSRDYLMFGILAGVRAPTIQLFEPKGIPKGRLGYETEDDYWYRIAPESSPALADHDGWASMANAERWIEDGCSTPDFRDGKLFRVSGPDWHSHSWLTREELEKAVDHYAKIVPEHYPAAEPKAPAEWRAIVAAMRAFEDAGAKTRIVFWFDN